jgi:RNA polymerase sigma factor (sigma-70 family)
VDSFQQLVTRAQGGDTTAYGELVRRFQDMAYGYAYAILSDFCLAQDAAQEAFIEAYRCLPSLRLPTAFPGWLKRIVFKHCDRLTRGKRLATTPLDAAGDLPTRAPGPADQAEIREMQRAVLRAIGELPTHQREVTALYYIDGYSQNEIATFLEVPTSTVKSRLYASRRQLKERMMDMVRDTLQSNALPESFTEGTLAQAVARAAELNKERQFDEAEGLLRDVLGKAPSHTAALKELNRTLMQGRVYGEARWDRLPELVEHGRAILASGSEDENVYRDVARTLLAVPAMPQAIKFLEEWIEKKGPNLERLGMLAWAKGCVAEYDEAESLWEDLLVLVPGASPEEAATAVQYVCLTLVDCFASADKMDRAERVAQAGWQACRDLDAFPHDYERPQDRRTDARWLRIFHQAGLSLDDVAQQLLEKLGPKAERDLLSQGVALSIRAWVDDAAALTADWLDWAKACAQAGEWKTLKAYGVGPTLRALRRPNDLSAWARAARNWLETVPGPEAQSLHERLKWDEFNGWTYLESGDIDGAERIARKAIEQEGYQVFGCFLVDVAVSRGEPTPRDVVQFVKENGIEAIDEYGMEGWYIIAREAAAAGDEQKAFEALERALSYWSNSLLYDANLWENDACWGELREHPEYKRIYREKRERIGPIYGQLHYFPGW